MVVGISRVQVAETATRSEAALEDTTDRVRVAAVVVAPPACNPEVEVGLAEEAEAASVEEAADGAGRCLDQLKKITGALI